MNKPFYLYLSILDLSEPIMYEFWHDYIKPKFLENAKLGYMVTDSFITRIKTDDILKILQEMFKKDLTIQIMKEIDRYLKEKTRKQLD